MTNDVPDRVWPDRVWLEDEFGEGHDDQFQYGYWDCRNVYGYQAPYLRATPAREHADELVEASADLLHEIDRFFRDDDGCWLDGVDPGPKAADRLRALLARIEQETDRWKGTSE